MSNAEKRGMIPRFQNPIVVIMDILSVSFDTTFTLTIKDEQISIRLFKTLEHGNVKFGIDAPKSVTINREEIHLALSQQE